MAPASLPVPSCSVTVSSLFLTPKCGTNVLMLPLQGQLMYMLRLSSFHTGSFWGTVIASALVQEQAQSRCLLSVFCLAGFCFGAGGGVSMLQACHVHSDWPLCYHWFNFLFLTVLFLFQLQISTSAIAFDWKCSCLQILLYVCASDTGRSILMCESKSPLSLLLNIYIIYILKMSL